jgi:alpha-ketoglutarate-dependent taurine dioxygenase
VLRTRLEGALSFRELLRRVREVTLGAYAHQDVPFERLVEELQPERDPGRNPLVQAVLSFQNAPGGELSLPGLQLSPWGHSEVGSKWDLALFVWETEQGLGGAWKYSPDLFDASAVARLSRRLLTLLASIVAHPDARIDKLDLDTAEEQDQRRREKQRLKQSGFSKFKSFTAEPESAAAEELVRAGFVGPDERLPLVLRPATPDVEIVEWTTNNRASVRAGMLKHGAVLFRGCHVYSAAEFERLALAVCPELYGEYGDLPREGVSEKVYGSTPYPADACILFHNESAHLQRWPLNIFFHCVVAAQEGGETPLVDCRRIYERLDPKLRERFAEKRLMYVRNFTEGLDVSWRDFFQTGDRAEVEGRCRAASIEVEWRGEGGLRMRQVCRAVARHPKTSEMVFFNQIMLHHVACLEPSVRESMSSLFREEDLPRNVYYGDGTPIEPSAIEEIRGLYWETAVKFPWQKGDVLAVDNMLVAHARMPFAGPRRILVAMGEMISDVNTAKE